MNDYSCTIGEFEAITSGLTDYVRSYEKNGLCWIELWSDGAAVVVLRSANTGGMFRIDEFMRDGMSTDKLTVFSSADPKEINAKLRELLGVEKENK